MVTSYQVAPPKLFTFSRPKEWMRWNRQFKLSNKRPVSKEKDDEVQLNMYSMGDDADDILQSFGLSKPDSKKVQHGVSQI